MSKNVQVEVNLVNLTEYADYQQREIEAGKQIEAILQKSGSCRVVFVGARIVNCSYGRPGFVDSFTLSHKEHLCQASPRWRDGRSQGRTVSYFNPSFRKEYCDPKLIDISCTRVDEHTVRYKVVKKIQTVVSAEYKFTGKILTDVKLQLKSRNDIQDPDNDKINAQLLGSLWEFKNSEKMPRKKIKVLVIDGVICDKEKKPLGILNHAEVLESIFK